MNRQEANDLRVLQFCRAERIAFICECEDDNCRRTVVMTPAAFILQRESGEAILFPEHAALADAPIAAEQEAALRESTLTVPSSDDPRSA